MILSRFPDARWTDIVDVVSDTIIRYSSDIQDEVFSWGDVPDLWIHGYFYWDWYSTFQGVDSVDTGSRHLHISPPQHPYGYRAGQRYYFVNAMQLLDQPGEWYLNQRTQHLYFWPPESIEQDDVYLSILSSDMLLLNNTTEVNLQGFILEGSAGSAVIIDGGDHNLIAGCTIRNIIDDAVEITRGYFNGITGCDLYNLGAGGIKVEGGDRLTLERGDHFVDNNHIYHFANYQKTYHPAVSIRGVGHRVTHNVIHDAPHMGLYWAGNEHQIQYNEIYDIAGETGDVGAMYSGRDWTWRGNVIRYNYLHNIEGPGNLGAVGVYLDDAMSGTVVFGNIFYQSSMAVLVGGGRDNLIQNNIFIDCDPAIHVDNRGQTWAAAYIAPGGSWRMYKKLEAVNHDEPPYSTRYPELASILDGDPALPEGNEIISNLKYTGRWLDFDADSWGGIIHFEDNTLTNDDPGFADIQNQDWHLSPVFYFWHPNFQEIPVDSIGLYPSEYRDGLTGVEMSDNTSDHSEDSVFIANYPNPCNASIQLIVCVPRSGPYKVEVYNLLGQRIETLLNRDLEKGLHRFTFTPDNYASGLYFCCLQGINVFRASKIQLVK
jgi:hypothetical protein